MILSNVFSSPICPGSALFVKDFEEGDLKVTENDCILGLLKTLLPLLMLFYSDLVGFFVLFVLFCLVGLLVGFCFFFLRQEFFCIALTVLELTL